MSSVKRFDGYLHIQFDHADGLHLYGDELNALCIKGESGEVVPYNLVSINDDTLILDGKFEQTLNIQFACTPYYEVNIYNRSEIPAIPFEVNI